VLRTLTRSAQPTRASGGQLMGELTARDIGIIETSEGSRSRSTQWATWKPSRLIATKEENSLLGGSSSETGLIRKWHGVSSACSRHRECKTRYSSIRAGSGLVMSTKSSSSSQITHKSQILLGAGIRIGNWPYLHHLTLSLLKKAQGAGHGHKKLVSRDSSFGAYIPSYATSFFLSSLEHVKVKGAAWECIQANIDLLQKETGLKKEDIISLPVLYENDFQRRLLLLEIQRHHSMALSQSPPGRSRLAHCCRVPLMGCF